MSDVREDSDFRGMVEHFKREYAQDTAKPLDHPAPYIRFDWLVMLVVFCGLVTATLFIVRGLGK